MSRSFGGFGRPCADEEPSEILVNGILQKISAATDVGDAEIQQEQSNGASVGLGSDASQTQQMTSTVELTVG
jgi:hypothetical protein